mmetsp:Transcript_33959/g.44808  ORF Transcript_33959/g.44808 Transcript_33959/m.44808 type:complete len:115 (-) Transcript_33959:379-723(-)|eukprot:CAMPEP_0117758354 /NCGR_PEP_ID=MMETSP0947-20121206/15325_1 /TAXON_ID=44440 /ORGANISM="Chattonella subsalsa, Strain CCMP2191" /LENGTH=114 /DNA_ID=CAMNT_0005578519 /DNA_START=137 /DNA_END=481 /DNA_ORIENTATION=-
MGAASSVPQIDEDRKIMLQDLRRMCRGLVNGRDGIMSLPKREVFEMAQKQCNLGIEEQELLSGLEGELDLYNFCRKLDSLIAKMDVFAKDGSQIIDPIEEEEFRSEWYSLVSEL